VPFTEAFLNYFFLLEKKPPEFKKKIKFHSLYTEALKLILFLLKKNPPENNNNNKNNNFFFHSLE
jgi:hypothetical protein